MDKGKIYVYACDVTEMLQSRLFVNISCNGESRKYILFNISTYIFILYIYIFK